MIYKTCYWDNETKQQLERDCTPAETAEIELRKLPQPPVVPEAVTMRQARRALLGAGLLTTVNSAIAAMTGASGDAARIDWEFASDVSRSQPLVLALGSTLGLTSAQLDGLFIAAATI